VLLALLGIACSSEPTAPPYDSVIVDRRNPQRTVIEFDGRCTNGVSVGNTSVQGKNYSLTQDGKTYYFSSEEAKDRFMKDFPSNAQRAEANYTAREKTPS
jgi:YHS domain-containing protein